MGSIRGFGVGDVLLFRLGDSVVSGLRIKTRDPLAELRKLRAADCFPIFLSALQCQSKVERERASVVEMTYDEAVQWLRDDCESEMPEAGEWPLQISPTRSTILPSGIKASLFGAQVDIGLVPSAAPWDIFGELDYGGWNSNPGPSIHRALHRQWNIEYQAEPVAIAHDTLECRVTRPPTTREEALELAKIQYLYCPDIVEQGTETLSGLAAHLLNSERWYFWWD